MGGGTWWLLSPYPGHLCSAALTRTVKVVDLAQARLSLLSRVQQLHVANEQLREVMNSHDNTTNYH